MLHQQTIEQLRVLKLFGMMTELVRQNTPDIVGLSFEERFGMLANAQVHDVEQRRLTRLLKSAKLKIPSACIENIDYKASRGLDRAYLKSLSNCDWVTQGHHIIFTGLTGVGKTWLACAFAQQVLRKGVTALFYRFPLLLEDLDIARKDGSLPKLRNKLARAKLLIIDDWALSSLNARSRQDILELVEARTGSGAFIFTSQLPLNKWHDYINEPTFADAILDRIIHRSHSFELHGDSMRKTIGGQHGKR
jgi:DNA replication protein DnaC